MAAVSSVMSDMFYQAALGFDRPFTLEDITPDAIVGRRALAQQWLDELVARGELLLRSSVSSTVTYRWVNW